MSPEYPEINYFDVELLKDNQNGLGITIAGYVGRQSDNPGRLTDCNVVFPRLGVIQPLKYNKKIQIVQIPRNESKSTLH